MRLYNYLTRKIEEFTPLSPPRVSLYTCGPTVYDFAHIGNLRTYIFEDLLRRTLEYAGYRVKHIMNITDIEDKIVKKSRAEGVEFTKITRRFTKAFREDLRKLNLLPAEHYPTVTEHIPQIIQLIQTLLAKKHAYVAKDGSVYFDISSFHNYGELAQLDKQTLKKGASGRILADEYAKEEVSDFVLWKAKTQPDEPSWPSPWGEGRPGWHIECSVLAMEYLGPQIDIHAGAIDLIFPHHTNEIAQSEAATGKKFVNFWVEGEHLLVEGKKMSKSLGNFYTLREIEERDFDPLAFRYLVLQTHYRKKLNFSWEALASAQQALLNLQNHVINWKLQLPELSSSGFSLSGKYHHQFKKSLFDDLNLPQALATVWNLVEDENLSPGTRLATLKDFDRVLGLRLDKLTPPTVPQEIFNLLEERENLRKAGKFNQADAIRKKIEERGFRVADTPSGPRLTVPIGPKKPPDSATQEIRQPT